jgi:hypothetical protein
VGVSRRSLTGWQARAWSRDPRDVECVCLVRMVVRGRLAAVGHERRDDQPVALVPIDDVLRDLDEGWV